LTISLSGNFFFKLNSANARTLPVFGLARQNYSLVAAPRRLALFLIFLLLLFKSLAGATLLLTRPACLKFSYRKFFLRQFTIQKAPMAHRQWSQEQYGVRGFFFKVLLSLRPQQNAPVLVLASEEFSKLRLCLGSLQQPFSLFLRASRFGSSGFFSMFSLIALSSALLANAFSSLLPPKSVKFSFTALNGLLR
jgi:hypothetical protein